MAAPVIDLTKYKPVSTAGGFSIPTATTAKNKYVATLSSDPLAKLNLTNVGMPKTQTGITNQNVLPDYMRTDQPSSNGATSPAKTSIAPATSKTPSSPGSYQGVAITPGTDAEIAAQIAQIDRGSSLGNAPQQNYITSLMGGNTGSGYTGAGNTGSTDTGTKTKSNAYTPSQSYTDAMEAYLNALGTSNALSEKVQKETLASNHAYQDILDASGGTTSGAQGMAALNARRSNASLADLGIAQNAATDASNLALERLKFEQGILPSNDPYTLSPGQTRYDAQGNVIASLPEDGSSSPTSVQEYQFAQQQGYTGTFDQWKNSGGSDRVLTATEAQSLGVPFGTKASEAYGITPSKALTEAQAKDVTYGQRGTQANDIIGQMQNTIVKYNPGLYATYSAIEPNTIGNSIVPDDIRQIRQAERNFATAILRRESGAAISASEFDTVEKQYFPRPGDDAATLAQKAQNRKTAIDSFMANIPASYNAGSVNQGSGGSGSIWDF